MGLFDKKNHIKSAKEFRKSLKKERYLSPEERKTVEAKAFRFIREPGGMSKEEWAKKVVKPMERDKKDKIDIWESAKLKKLGK